MQDPSALPPPSRWDLRPFELLHHGWCFVRPHYLPVMAVILLVLSLDVCLSRHSLIGPPGLFVVNCTGNSGLCWYLLQAYQGRPVSLATFVEPMQRYATELLLLHLAAGLLILAGLVCAIFPGLYIAVLLELSLPFLLLKGGTPWAAMAGSKLLVERQLGDFVALSLVLVVLNGVAALPFGIGLLFSLPATCGAATLLAAQVFQLERPVGASGMSPEARG